VTHEQVPMGVKCESGMPPHHLNCFVVMVIGNLLNMSKEKCTICTEVNTSTPTLHE